MKEYMIKGMTCENCVNKINTALLSQADVKQPKVQLEPPQLTLDDDSKISIEKLKKIIEPLGDYVVLEPNSDSNSTDSTENISNEPPESLKPLFIIVAYILGGTFLISLNSSDFNLQSIMSYFMGIFFIVFSLFKMIDLKGFQNAFSTYDLLGMRYPAYSKYYPFLELTLGILYVSKIALTITNIITVFIMFVGSIGVLKALLKDQKIKCACLGTALNLPMTKVTLAEDLIMGLMAAGMLYWG